MVFEETISINYNARTEGFEAGLKRVATGLAQEKKALAEQIRAINERIVAMKKSTDVDDKALQALQRERTELKKSLDTVKDKIRSIKAYTEEKKKQVNVIDQGTAALKRSVVQYALAAVGVSALTAEVTKSTTTFGDFERTLNTIGAVSGATSQEMAQLKQVALNLGASTIFSAQEVAEAFKELIKAGLSVGEAIQAMGGVLDAAAASGEGLAGTSEIVIGTLRGFGLEAKESGRVADVLAEAANKSSADISDLGLAMKQVAPIAATSNQNLEDMAATLAIMSDRMIKGGDAGTDLRGILARLQNPSKEASEALSQIGVKIADSEGKIKPFLEILNDMREGLQKFDQQTKNQFLIEIAGLENLKTAGVLTSITREEMEAMQIAMQNSEGAAERMADQINKGVNTSLEQFGGEIETANIKLGEALSPTVVRFIDELADMVNSIHNNREAVSTIGSLFETLASIIENTIRATANLITILDNLVGSLFEGLTASNALVGAFKGVITGLDLVATGAYIATEAVIGLVGSVERLVNLDFSGALDRVTSSINNIRDASVASSNRFVNNFGGKGTGFKAANTVSGLPLTLTPIIQSTTKPLPQDGSGSGKLKAPKKDKKSGADKAKREAERADADSLRDSAERLKFTLDELALTYREQAVAGGPYEGRIAGLNRETSSLADKNRELIKEINRLNNLEIKTAKGQKERSSTIIELNNAIRENKTAMAENSQEITKFVNEQVRAAQESRESISELQADNALQAIKLDIQEQQEVIGNAFKQNKLTVQEYYDKQLELIRRNADAELKSIERQKQALQEKLTKRFDETPAEFSSRSNKILEDIAKLDLQSGDIRNQTSRLKRELDTQVKDARDKVSQSIKDGLVSSVSSAFEEAINSGNVFSALQSLGRNLKSVLANAFTEVLSGALKNILGKIDLSQLTAGKAGLGALGLGLAGAGIKLAGSKNKAGQIGGVALGAGGGALAGAIAGSIVPGIGTAIGAVAGGLLGGTTAATKTGFFSSKAGVATAFALGGPLGFLALSKRNKAKKQQEIANAQSFFDGILSSVDSNDLISLKGAIKKAKNRNSQGSDTRAIKVQALTQLTALYKQRLQVVNQAIDDIKFQTEIANLEGSALTDPYKTALVNAQIASKQLQKDINSLKEQFKDSQEAQTAILELESAKRKALAEEEKESLKTTAEGLRDLFAARDEAANANVFRRAKSNEIIKAEEIQQLDAEISRQLKAFNSLKELFAQVGLPALPGLENVIAAASNAGTYNNQIEIIINEADNPQQVQELVIRGIDAYFQKIAGTAVA